MEKNKIKLSEVLDADEYIKNFPADLLIPVMKNTNLVSYCTHKQLKKEFKKRGWTYRKDFNIPYKTEEPAEYYDRQMLVNTAKWFVVNAIEHKERYEGNRF